MRRLLVVLAMVGALPPIAFVALALDILSYASVSDRERADAVIVLGAAVYDDEPTPVFEERLRHALDLYLSGRVRLLVMPGGAGPGDTLAEGEAGREWAVAHGIPAEAVIVEAHSRTTKENLANAVPLIRERGIGRVLVVSDPLHMRRAMRIAADLGLDAHPSPTPSSRYQSWATQAPMLIREVYFLAVYLLTGN